MLLQILQVIGGFSKEYLIDSLTKIGQIETQYETKIQRGNNPEIENFYARSYWQIEVDTAKDLLKKFFSCIWTKI